MVGGTPLAGEVMLRHPKTMSPRASVEEVRAALANDHVHMVLLTEGGSLVGTLVGTDLPPQAPAAVPALSWSRLLDRTVPPDAPADTVQALLVERGLRRMAVVDHEGTLLGLMCLKRSRTGFCSDDDVASRAESRQAEAD
jgi:CBS domain-containing protein